MLPPTSYDKPSLNFRGIYDAYPRHREPRTALRAIEKAHKRLIAGEFKWDALPGGFGPISAYQFLLNKAAIFAASPAGQNVKMVNGRLEDFRPYPATWFNASSYLEDPKEWGYQEPRPVRSDWSDVPPEQLEAMRAKYEARGKG